MRSLTYLTACMLGGLAGCEASFKLHECLEVEKLEELLVHKVDGLVRYIV